MNLWRYRVAAVVLLCLWPGSAPAQERPLLSDYIAATITKPPDGLRLDPFYKKFTDALGIPIVSSEKVPDAALLVARDIVIHMLAKRSDLREAMIAQDWRVAVMAQSEVTTDIPEHKDRKKPEITDRRITPRERENYELIRKMSDKEYWDRRARGLGGNPTSCAEENLLGYPGTRYYGENILVHEFAHAVMGGGIKVADPGLFAEIQRAYEDAMALGLWKGHYASTNANEYWAEGTQVWFWSNYEYLDGDRHIKSPLDLLRYDPTLYRLLSRVYPDHHIPMDVYYQKDIKPNPAAADPVLGGPGAPEKPPAPKKPPEER